MPVAKSYINETNLFDDLKAMGRENFSYEGAKALMSYLEELSNDIGENIEYDPIAFCCDYSEYKDLKEIQGEYSDIETMDDLLDNTTVIEFEGGLIIQDY